MLTMLVVTCYRRLNFHYKHKTETAMGLFKIQRGYSSACWNQRVTSLQGDVTCLNQQLTSLQGEVTCWNQQVGDMVGIRKWPPYCCGHPLRRENWHGKNPYVLYGKNENMVNNRQTKLWNIVKHIAKLVNRIENRQTHNTTNIKTIINIVKHIVNIVYLVKLLISTGDHSNKCGHLLIPTMSPTCWFQQVTSPCKDMCCGFQHVSNRWHHPAMMRLMEEILHRRYNLGLLRWIVGPRK
jgi:hypothetical protein